MNFLHIFLLFSPFLWFASFFVLDIWDEIPKKRKNNHRIIAGCSVEMKNKRSNEIRVVSVVDTYKEKYIKMDVNILGETCCKIHGSIKLIEGKDEWKILYVVKQGNMYEAKKMIKNIENGDSPNVTKYNFQKDIDIDDLVILNVFNHNYDQKFQIGIVRGKQFEEREKMITIDLNDKDMEFTEADMNMDEWEVMRKFDC